MSMKTRFILYRDIPEYPISGNIFLYCFGINRLRRLIQRNKQYRFILVCKAEHLGEIYDSNIEHYIYQIFTLGDCTELNIKNREVTMVNTNENDLMFEILCAAVEYTDHEEIEQNKLENYGLADTLRTDNRKLLQQMETFF